MSGRFSDKQRHRTTFFNPVLKKKQFKLTVEFPFECEDKMTVDEVNKRICQCIQDWFGSNRVVKTELSDELTGEKAAIEIGGQD